VDRLHAMSVFVKVAECGSFAEAARRIHISPPAVTRAIGFLEDHIGARLLTRTTRAVKLTEAGERYFESAVRLLCEIGEAEINTAGVFARPSGEVTISAPLMFGEMYVRPLLTDFLDLYPAVTGKLILDDRVVNMVDEEIDAAVRVGHLRDASYAAVKVGEVRKVICAAPSYIDEHGLPKHPGDLTAHRVIGLTSGSGIVEWHFGDQEETSVHLRPQLRCNLSEAGIGAARAGWGIVRALSYQVGGDLIEGRLKIILPEYEEPPLPVHVVHPDVRRASAKVRAFFDHAVDALRSNRLLN